jgi:putative ABC transport system permease protein
MLIVAGSILAILISWFAMDEWLTGFAYRAGMNPLLFVLATVVGAAVALAAVALQSYRTARADPVEALRL